MRETEMVFPDWSDSEDDWGKEWKGENWNEKADVRTPERRPTITAAGVSLRLRHNCTRCSGAQGTDTPWYECACQQGGMSQTVLEARRIQLLKDDWMQNVQEDEVLPLVPELPFGVSLSLNRPTAAAKKTRKTVNKKPEGTSATAWLEHAAAEKILRLANEKLVNNGGRPPGTSPNHRKPRMRYKHYNTQIDTQT